ncbi:cilia- and flagella-associated protein 61-like [Frieseomelitta varia]|uniref:cilia- and flagella-associated protein 61-like n=1 Tax=Frieseomelitta varia TaxID=561572 RepID=UPI001CB6935C|nr:cilia- and flagella-associated protein 61-like [Frieseomelitta varia]
MFVHILVWDRRYTGHFFADLLTGLFNVTSYLQHVILVIPPRIIIPGVDVFEQQMIKIPPRYLTDKPSVQSIYMTNRHLENPRLKVRRVVEEDNDDVVTIIDAETSLVKEFYGEFYVSEIVRHPDNCRRLIVSEDDEGLATGVMFLNSNIDLDTLNENFELIPYNGLRKPHEMDKYPPEIMQPASEIFFSIFSRTPRDEPTKEFSEKLSPEGSMEAFKDADFNTSRTTVTSNSQLLLEFERPTFAKISTDPSLLFFLDPRSTVTNYYQMKVMSSAFAESFFRIPRRTVVMSREFFEDLVFDKIDAPSQPVYHGDVNAFVLEIFTMRDEMKCRWSRNFVEAAFECYPEMDYCVTLLPFSHPFLPLLKHFVRVPLKCNKDYPMTLYVTHRAALLGQIRIREAMFSDREGVLDLLQRVPKSKQVLMDFDAAMNRKPSGTRCYVFQWNDMIVGVTILRAENEVTYVRRRYHVEDYIAEMNIRGDAYGRILHFILMPIFSVHLPYFFCEISRFSGMIVLYYRLAEKASSALTRTHPLTICLNSMIPVKPRKRIEYKYYGLVETDEPDEQKDEPFSLFMTTPRLAMMPRSIIDSKVVVVGASDCGVAFVEQLAFGHSFVRFANITLISPNGLPFEEEDETSERLLPFKGRYCRKYRRLTGARSWINLVYGTVISIQRKEKYVTVMHQGNITYDYLILTCGMQYQRPWFQDELEEQRRGEFLEHETPWNCLTINDDAEAAICLEKINKLTDNLKREKRIIIYGHNIDCYCALQGLLEFGIEGSWITLIQPPLQECETHESAFFDNCEVYAEVMKSISRSNIEILVGWELTDWNLRDSLDGRMIETIVVRLKGKLRTLECDALVNFREKTINMTIFLAICKSGLMFDGQLIIDTELRTNDPSIFAAGTITKYCRRFYSEIWQHVHFNSIEIGEKLARILRSIIENEHRGVETPEEAPERRKKVLAIPVFRTPKVVACTLPGGYRYLYVGKPGKHMMRRLAIHYNIYGQVLVTGSCTSDIGYFRIRLNRFDVIETVTCFTKQNIEVHHMITLYGKHESLLNELKTRFEKSLIADFYAYFREPWAMAVFYDRFECLRVENRATLLSKTAIPGQSLVDDCIRALMKSEWNVLKDNDRQAIQSRFAGSVYQQEIEGNLLDFLQFAEEDLPVYCTPGKLRELYLDIENSPLYTNL